jgi:putative DNA primase/helicase
MSDEKPPGDESPTDDKRRRTPAEDVTGIPLNDSIYPHPDVWAVLRRRPPRGKHGKETATPSLQNLMLILERDPRWAGRILGNDFDGETYVDGRLLTDAQEMAIYRWIERHYGINANLNLVSAAVRFIASEHTTHPVRDYLEALRWDGRRRLGDWLADYCGAEASPLTSEMATRWAISAVARVMSPGCQVDTCLILAGRQGARKSSAFRALAVRDEWFSDSALDLRNKDAFQSLRGVWLWELAELDSVRRTEATAVKAFLTSRWDRFRPSYGRNVVRWGRQNIFVGTTNEQAFLSDPTGSRRFWPVRVGRIDVPGLVKVRDQLWAEAVALYRQGERWYLQGKSEDDLREASGDYQHTDPWHDAIETWAAKQAAPFTLPDVLKRALGREVADCNNGHQARAAAVLTQAGYTQKRLRLNGERARWWWKGAHGGREW